MLDITKMKIFLTILAFTLIGLAETGSNVFAQQPYRGSNRQVDQLLTRIETRANAFRQSLESALNQARLNGTSEASEVRAAVRDFNDANYRLRNQFRTQGSVTSEVQEVLNRASRIDSFMRSAPLTARAQNDWRYLRSDLDQLARYSNIGWRWENTANPPQSSTALLTGTWRLDISRSDNLDNAVDRVISSLPANEQQRARDRLSRRLDAPETIAIEQRGRRFTIASTRAPQTSFDADGRTRTEYTDRGRPVRITVSLQGDQLVVNRTGSQGNDYNVTFDPLNNGQRMRVIRRIYAERFNQPLVVTSVYEKTSDIAQLNLYSGGPDDANINGPDRRRFIVPNNTRLTAVLNTNLSTSSGNSGNRFSMVVRSPSQYNGAVIEGYLTEVERSGRVTGRAKISLDFDRIRLRDGNTYDFKGYIENVRTPGGDNIRVDNEGTVREDSQTERTITRSGIGAAVGAILGAIAGGGSGAAIGAAIGAGAGAGSVIIQGRDDLDIPSGTELDIRSSAPTYREARR
ncbi:MAG: hypothetical protein L0226_02855 [Acidobacteria bacterium]|nr:hypothetical protein [Acidobacteriota bacterium]